MCLPTRMVVSLLCQLPYGFRLLVLTSSVEPYPSGTFKAGQRELAQDLILREQQIEYLISILPGLDHSEEDQEQRIQKLEEELKAVEAKRKVAVKEKEILLAKLDEVIRNVKRP
jgi:mediator of RNA polymerase II transcription subunit 21